MILTPLRYGRKLRHKKFYEIDFTNNFVMIRLESGYFRQPRLNCREFIKFLQVVA
jgi:hypothetical protein